MTVWQKVVWIAMAGAAGTISRYGMTVTVQRLCGVGFPWGTLVVNSLGCFLFGAICALADERSIMSEEARLVVLVGFMGAFTTFSTFAFETSGLLSGGQWALAAGNIIAQNLLGIVCVFLGFAAVRLW